MSESLVGEDLAATKRRLLDCLRGRMNMAIITLSITVDSSLSYIVHLFILRIEDITVPNFLFGLAYFSLE